MDGDTFWWMLPLKKCQPKTFTTVHDTRWTVESLSIYWRLIVCKYNQYWPQLHASHDIPFESAGFFGLAIINVWYFQDNKWTRSYIMWIPYSEEDDFHFATVNDTYHAEKSRQIIYVGSLTFSRLNIIPAKIKTCSRVAKARVAKLYITTILRQIK